MRRARVLGGEVPPRRRAAGRGAAEGRDFADRVVSRIKVLADLDISERRVPQDGRLKLSYGGRAIDVRVSIMPNLYGEDAVLRILDRYQLSAESTLSIEHLGFDAANARFIRRLGAMPYGCCSSPGRPAAARPPRCTR